MADVNMGGGHDGPNQNLKKRTHEQFQAGNKGKRNPSDPVLKCLEVYLSTVREYVRSKREFKAYKSQHRQFHMPSTRCFDACKFSFVFWVDDLVVEFGKQLEAGVKELLPRKGTYDIDVPRYPEVSPLSQQ